MVMGEVCYGQRGRLEAHLVLFAQARSPATRLPETQPCSLPRLSCRPLCLPLGTQVQLL